jgi:hypothetical protein
MMITIVKSARDVRTGRFTTVRYARRHPKTTVVEIVMIMRRREKRRRSR